jgi:hypothetical protein
MEPDYTNNLSIEELETRMRPGQLSQTGFLGPKERLSDVLSSDAKTLQELGLTYEQLATALEELIEKADERRGRPVNYKGKFIVQVEAYTGFQICPFTPDPHSGQCTADGGVRFGSLDWKVRNLVTGKEMRGPGLIVHLVRAHHFFEGFESPHRVDPRQLASLLELGPTTKV